MPRRTLRTLHALASIAVGALELAVGFALVAFVAAALTVWP